MPFRAAFGLTATCLLATWQVQAQQGGSAVQQVGGSSSQRALESGTAIPGGANLAAGKELPELPNPAAIQLETSTLAALANQKHAVDREVTSQMKAGIRPAAAQTRPSHGGTLLAPTAGSANAPGISSLGCSTNPAMRILKVAGTAEPAVFTPILAYDLYTVSGCSFGNQGPDGKAYIYKKATFQAEFQILEWHDNWLKLCLDPKTSGWLDYDDVTLVIKRADGTQTSKGGFKFHAARSAVPLELIPSRWARLVTWSKGNRTFSPEYLSPAIIDGKSAGPSAYVSRLILGEKFDPAGQPAEQQYDAYDLSGLAPGWVGKAARLQTFGTNCPLVVTYRQDFGNWRTEWDGATLRVYLGDETCSSVNPAAPDQNTQNLTGSFYRLTVVVSGPRCTDPLTGRKDLACVQRLQQGAQER